MKNEVLGGVIQEYERKKQEIKDRLLDFRFIPMENYFYELVFCILTPQSNAKKCWQAVEELRNCEFQTNIETCLQTKTRFHKNKARYVKEVREKWLEIKEKIQTLDIIELRNWLAENIKGLGMKEASHFLRNIGKSENQIAILDRHILRNLQELNIINQIPNLNKANYFKLEQKMKNFSQQINIPLDELDLLFWSKETGEIFK